MFKQFAVLALIAFVSVATSAQDTVSFKRDSFGRIMVPAETAVGEPVYFQFDTAAGRSAINSAKVTAFDTKRYEGGIRHMASNGFERVPVGSVPHLQVAGVNLKEHIVAIYPEHYQAIHGGDQHTPGVVGFDVFRGRLVQIDPKAKTMTHAANSGFLDINEWGIVPGHPNSNASILTSFTYNGTELTVLFATGFSRSAINVTAFELLRPGVKRKSLKPKLTLTRGMENRTRPYGSLVLSDVTISDWSLGDLEVVVAPLQTAQIVGESKKPLLVLGADVLTRQKLVFDYRDFQIWYARDSRQAVAQSTSER